MAALVECAAESRLRKESILQNFLVRSLTILALSFAHYASVEGAPFIVTLSSAKSCDPNFAGCCLNVAGVTTVTPYVPPPFTRFTKVQIRPSITTALADPKYVAKYNLAYSLLRKSGQWDTQVATHCSYANSFSLGINVHFNWNFLPWHRWYLFWHERMLQKMINDTTFMLPYWDWDNPNAKKIFPQYQNKSSALYDPRRNPSKKSIQNWLNTGTTSSQMVSCVVDAADPTSFFGFPLNDAGGSLMETSVHGTVHVAVGQQKSPFRDMGNLAVSSNDSLFYVHHNNIDRLWWLWKRLPPDANNVPRSEPSNPDWLNSSYLFFDEKGALRSVKVSDCIDTRRLGYTFEDINNPWIKVPLSPVGGAKRRLLADTGKSHASGPNLDPADIPVSEPEPQLHHGRHLQQASPNDTATGPFTLNSAPTTVGIVQPPVPVQSPNPLRKNVFKNRIKILRVDGFQPYVDQPMQISVFVNSQRANLTSVTCNDPGFLASFINVPSGSTPPGQRPPPKNIQIPLENYLRRSNKNNPSLTFTLVGYSFDPVTGSAKYIPGDVASVNNVYIQYR